jgi:hypothetical protein
MSDELTPSSDFFTDVRGILAGARRAAYTAVNSAMVAAYWQIGRRIVEESSPSPHGHLRHIMPRLNHEACQQIHFARQGHHGFSAAASSGCL